MALPLFNTVLTAPGLLPPLAVAAMHQHLAAGAVLFATPEYAFRVPDSFKNTLDWLVAAGSLYGKPTGAPAASPSASRGAHALASLLLTLPAAILSVPAARTRLGAEDRPTDPALTKDLQSVVTALVAAAAGEVS